MSTSRGQGNKRGWGRGRGRTNTAIHKPLTTMDLIASVSRSSGLEKDGDTLKDYQVQVKYREFIQTKLDEHWERYPYHRDRRPNSQDTQKRSNEEENILILFRKLREGLSSSGRTDAFAVEVYETSLYLSVLFASPKQATATIPHLSSVPEANSNRTVTAIIALLHYLVQSYPSQRDYESYLRRLTPACLPENALLWLKHLSSSIRRLNCIQFEKLSRPSAVPLPDIRSEERPATGGKYDVLDLPREATQRLLLLLRTKMRESTWTVIKKSYIELACHDGSETRLWLTKSLSLESDEVPPEDIIGNWLETRCGAGEIKKKEGVDGRWLICRNR